MRSTRVRVPIRHASSAVVLLALAALAFSQSGASAHGGPPLAAAPRDLGSGVPQFQVNFSSAGLPAGTAWSVTIGVYTAQSNLSWIAFSLPNGTYSYSIEAPQGVLPSPSHGSVTVAGANVSISVQWFPTYYIQFNETGLPSGATWHVYLGLLEKAKSSGVNIVYQSELNGTYSFNVGSNLLWVPSPLNGYVTVAGGNVTLNVTFYPPPARYNITFTESGLPSTASWYVTLSGVGGAPGFVNSSTAVRFYEQNGSYVYSTGATSGYLGHPSAGTVHLAGADLAVNIVFLPPFEVNVTFTETGLGGGTGWGASLDGNATVFGTAGSSINISTPNGSHVFAIANVGGFAVSPASGTILVAGVVVVVRVAFVPLLHPVTFAEKGLPGGSWWVTINGTSHSASAGAAISVSLAPGAYAYVVGNNVGYTALISGGTLAVGESAATVNISFAPIAASPTSASSPSLLDTPLAWVAVAVGAILVVALAYRLLRPRPPPSGSLAKGGPS